MYFEFPDPLMFYMTESDYFTNDNNVFVPAGSIVKFRRYDFQSPGLGLFKNYLLMDICGIQNGIKIYEDELGWDSGGLLHRTCLTLEEIYDPDLNDWLKLLYGRD